MSVTFAVDNVVFDRRAHQGDWCQPQSWGVAVLDMFSRRTHRPATGYGPKLEACSTERLLPGTIAGGGLVTVVGVAYNQHRALSMSPDHIWLAIAHGFAQHVKSNAEELRRHFVQHDGSKKLVVDANHFVKGGSNDWSEMFSQFSDQIGEHIGKRKDLLVCDFSTTGPAEKIASEVILMDAMSKYFSYGMMTLCGFSEITLEGEVHDWVRLLTKVQNLREFGDISWWLDPLEAVVEKMTQAAAGRPVDAEFWRSMYMESGGSGGPHISGWIGVFYPYIGRSKQKNPALIDGKVLRLVSAPDRKLARGIHNILADFPTQLSVVPVEWTYYDTVYDMHFVAGLGGGTEDERGGVRPAATWAVLDSTGLNAEQKETLGLV